MTYRTEFYENEVYMFSPSYTLRFNKPKRDGGSLWFDGGLIVKATTVPCIPLKDLVGMEVTHKWDTTFRGRIQNYTLEGDTHVGVYWYKCSDDRRQGMLYFWQDAMNLLAI